MIGPKIRRIYYSSSEICQETGISYSILRSWEKKYSELHPVKNKAGRKFYKPAQMRLVKKIVRLKNAGFTDKKIFDLLPYPIPSTKIPDNTLAEIRRELLEIYYLLNELK